MRLVLWLSLLLVGCGSAAAEPLPTCQAEARYDAAGPATGRFFQERLKGKKASAVRRRLGEPSCRSGRLWRYWLPSGCSYEKTVVSVWFRAGRVVRVTAVDIVTGQECM